jgi:hypothetical protein
MVLNHISSINQYDNLLFCFKFLKLKSQVLLVHSCNANYSGGRDQKDCNLKPAQPNSLPDPISNTQKKKAGGVAHVVEHLHSKHETPVSPKNCKLVLLIVTKRTKLTHFGLS